MYLAIDIGGTFTKYALVDADGTISGQGKYPSEHGSLEDFLGVISSIYEPVRGKVEGVGLSFPGIVDPESGQCGFVGGFPFFREENLYEKLSQVIDVPMKAERDGNCAALGEQWKGCLQDKNNAAVVIFGTGIAGAMIIRGRLYRGAQISAGEFSYIVSKDDEGMHMLPEDTSIRFITMRMAKEKGLSPDRYAGEDLFREASEGKEDAVDALNRFYRASALFLINLQTILDPEVIAIGGGISRQSGLVPRLTEEMEKLRRESWLNLYVPQLVRCEYGNDANLLGAVAPFVRAC